MQIRTTLNKYPILGYGMAGGIVLLAMAIVVGSLLSGDDAQGRHVEREWYYDLNTSHLFAAELHQFPPIDAPSGQTPEGQQAGVRAYVYGCGEGCDDARKRQIVYLEMLTPTLKQARTEGKYVEPNIGFTHTLVRKPDDTEWHSSMKPQGRRIIESLQPCPGGGRARRCFP